MKRSKSTNPPFEDFKPLIHLYQKKQFAALTQKINEQLKRYPNSYELWKLLGGTAASNQDYLLAINAFERAVKINPLSLDALYNLGVAYEHKQNLSRALSTYKSAIKIKPDFIEALINTANILLRNEEYKEAIHYFSHILKLNPNIPNVLNNYGIALAASGQLEKALNHYEKAISLNSTFENAFINKINALTKLGRFNDAINDCKKILDFNKSSISAHICMGNNYKELGKLEDALLTYQTALKIDPNCAEAFYNSGLLYHEIFKFDEAISAFENAIKIKSKYVDAIYALGVLLQDLKRNDEAAVHYQQVILLNPQHIDALNNLGVISHAKGDLKDAIKQYLLITNINESHDDAFNNLGVAYQQLGRIDASINAHEKAIALNPDNADAYNNLGIVLHDKGLLINAIDAYKKAVKLDPDFQNAHASYLHLKQHICDFSAASEIEANFERLGSGEKTVPPFSTLSWADDAHQQLLKSSIWGSHKYNNFVKHDFNSKRNHDQKLRVGYFGSDFHDHATMYLMNGLLREHDHTEFDIFIYSYGHQKQGVWRDSAKQSIKNFFDVANNSDSEIVDLARSHNLDIAIDLKGYTQHTRSGLFQYRLAPIQMNYLGYPGSMGVDFIDYIIADPIVIPEDQFEHYKEKIIFLPHTYQPNDNQREISDLNTTREDFGLSKDSFVFCCFNNNYKISIHEFSLWMNILREVDHGVLWLLKSNIDAELNLKKEALKFGIDSDRIIFAEKMSHADHIARHQHADLFLDTFNYNAHTTASDALWGGLPIVTKIGDQFAARVCASLLNAVGLPELITNSVEEYESLILSLARDDEKLLAIREKLKKNLSSEALFDTKRYTKNFENGLKAAFTKYLQNEAPSNIRIDDLS